MSLNTNKLIYFYQKFEILNSSKNFATARKNYQSTVCSTPAESKPSGVAAEVYSIKFQNKTRSINGGLPPYLCE